MKELDFDELDRAVNSLMTNVPKADQSAPEVTTKTLEITPTLDAASPPSFDTLEKATSQTTMPTPTVLPPRTSVSQSPLAARRGGRFMDVVHPSSDMKKPTPSHPVSRQGATIAPRLASDTPSLPDPIESPQNESELATQPDVTTPVTLPVTEQAAPPNEWPDPLEMADFKDEPEVKQENALPNPTKEPQMSPEKDNQEQDSKERPPLTSPFLPDTKVEKRPLGSAAVTSADEPDHTPVISTTAASAISDDPSIQFPADPTDISPQLPEELQSDLIAIEAGADTTMPRLESGQEADVDVDTEKETAVDHKEEVVATPISAPTPSPHRDEMPISTGATSIAQQYREEPSTSDQASGSIYDTDTYHQPLTHPVKKKSGWLWVVWILLILVVGAGAGAALYFSGIV